MRKLSFRRAAAIALALVFLLTSAAGLFSEAFGQSRRLPPQEPQKKNPRPEQTTPTGEQQQQDPPPGEVIPETETVKVATSIVNVEAVVINKKTKQIVPNLKREQFAIFEEGTQREITNFSTPEAPITLGVVMEYSKLGQALGFYGSGGFDPGTYEVIRPLAYFAQQFLRPPDDYVSVIAYDMRPTPLTDFTNNPARVNQVVNLLLRNQPVSREANLFDALKLALVGGRADSVVLENKEERWQEYAGMSSLQNRRKAVFLISTGIDTFSKINYDQARKIAQNAGVPIYIVGTGNLFFKKYEHLLSAEDGLGGATSPGRLTFLQAQNTLRTFAQETGGAYFPVTFESELPSVLQSINVLLRNQYSLAYNPGNLRDGKRRKIVVKVDVDGDGKYDEKEYEVRSRQFYNAPKG